MKTFASFVLAGTTALGSLALFNTPAAFAQPAAQVPQQARPGLTQVQKSGTVSRYFVGPMGRVRGLVLNDGTLVPLHGRQGEEVSNKVAVGQTVNVQGFAPQNNPGVIVRATVSGPDGAVLVQPQARGWHHHGPQGQAPDLQFGESEGEGHHPRWAEHRAEMQARVSQLPPRTASGTITHVLGGHRGLPHGVLLSDGTSVFFTPALIHNLGQHQLRVGETIQVTGRGNTYPQGSSVVAEHVTFADGSTANGPIGTAVNSQ